jgi:CelD/BcsL family acetyltransferase involved in cellulose biosynthesis
MTDARRMLEQSMSRKFRTKFTASQRYRRFIETTSEGLLARGWLRLVFLKVDGQRVAFVRQLRVGRTMFARKTGLDGAWEAQHVGMSVFGHAIQGAINEGCARYDFGAGADPYKVVGNIGRRRLGRSGSACPA